MLFDALAYAPRSPSRFPSGHVRLVLESLLGAADASLPAVRSVHNSYAPRDHVNDRAQRRFQPDRIGVDSTFVV